MGEAQEWLFEPSFNRAVKVCASDDQITSDAGVILLWEADHRLGLTEWLAGWPSLLQAGCEAQETSVQARTKVVGRPVIKCGSRFLEPAVPGLKPAGPPRPSRRGKRQSGATPRTARIAGLGPRDRSRRHARRRRAMRECF